MKKVLFASTALVAFGLAGAAQAADPIKLGLGGYMKWMFGVSDFTFDGGSYSDQSPNLHVDGEVWFVGSTTLDNGLKVAIKVELEADQSASPGQIDETFVTVDSGFGRLIIGNEDAAPYLMHVTGPDAAGMQEDNPVALKNLAAIGGLFGGGVGGGSVRGTTSINVGMDDHKLVYISPNFGGFTVGASYIPSLGSEGARVRGFTGDGFDMLDFAAAYNGTFSGVSVKASAGYAVLVDDVDTGLDHDEFSFGAQFGYAGFSAGGAVKHVDSDIVGFRGVPVDDVLNWTIGAQYAAGPYAVSVSYFRSEVDNVDNDYRDFHVSGKYNMGPGVDVIGSIGHMDLENVGDGWAGLVGLSLAF